MNGWTLALVIYVVAAVTTFVPVARILLRDVDLHPGGPSFNESLWFSEQAKLRLEQHYARIYGSLQYWKTQAVKYRAFHNYCLVWITLATASVPFLAQAITDDHQSKWLVTIVGAHAAVLLAFSRAFRVENNYKAFRLGESDFYDLYRRLLDRPSVFGRTEEQQLASYFEQVELIRRSMRTSETDNFPSVEDLTPGRLGNGDHAPPASPNT